MKKHFLKAFLLILSMTVFGQADQLISETAVPVKEKKETRFIQYHNRMVVFAPFYQGYERIKPKAFYAGVDAYLASALGMENENTLLNAQLRMGYNFFFNGRDHLTPIIGLGFIEDFFRVNHHTYHKPGIIYGTVGFLYNHEFNSIFNLGLNVKALLGGPISKKRFDWGSPVVGTDISLPITLRFGHLRHWDYRIEPFNIYLHGSDSSTDYWGFRNSIAYRF